MCIDEDLALGVYISRLTYCFTINQVHYSTLYHLVLFELTMTGISISISYIYI